MSDLDLFDDDAPPATLEDARERTGGTAFYNIVTILFLFLTILSAAFVALVYLNPNASFNPFPPQSALPTPTLFVIKPEPAPSSQLPNQPAMRFPI